MLDASYFSVIQRREDGKFYAWVPDLPGVQVSGLTEEEVIRALFQQIRQSVRDMILSGKPVPRARPSEELPPTTSNDRTRRLLLLIG